MQKNIVLIEFHQETNSFSNVPTTLGQFKSLALFYGDEVLNVGVVKHKRFQLAGFLKAAEKFGQGKINPIPTISAWAHSGGPIEKELYLHFKEYVLEIIRKQDRVDGVYASLHGAMGVEGMRDPESDLLRAIREIVGKEVPIGVSYDLHANITKEKVRLATFINSYRTNPHRDHFQVGYRAGEVLVKTVLGQVKPTMAFLKMPLLKGGGFTIDFLKPMRQIFRAMREMEKDPKVLLVSNFMSHIWIDDEELGWSCLAVTDNDPELAQQLAEKLAHMNWAVKDHKHPEPLSVENALEQVKKLWWKRKLGTTIFCDVSDIVAAGAPGENTHILRHLMEEAPTLRSYLPLRDQETASEVYEREIGESVHITVGGKLEKNYNRALNFQGTLLRKALTKFGKTVVLRHQNIFLILMELPNPVYRPSFFRRLGLSLWKADIVVVKNLFPFRLFYALYNRKTLHVNTAGTTNIDVFQVGYQKISRPIYPLDPIEDWKNPEVMK